MGGIEVGNVACTASRRIRFRNPTNGLIYVRVEWAETERDRWSATGGRAAMKIEHPSMEVTRTNVRKLRCKWLKRLKRLIYGGHFLRAMTRLVSIFFARLLSIVFMPCLAKLDSCANNSCSA